MVNAKNDFRTFLNREEERPRLAVLQKFKDINRVMTDTFLKQKAVDVPFRSTRVQGHGGEENSQQMIAIMKEMQSPKKFNSPMQRRNLFSQRVGPGDTII